ncbi:hypothetical protein HPB50_018239 [Hyalomma asiaticum]|uniref:Uncharacterized protein n=1 Tax=Hyalomma asiaticum TaxID=266040 RepID=A0ACB7SRS6_HYAAI|nr:hypothetical protein HPB50_018239 [Hyalomma asiaticum]
MYGCHIRETGRREKWHIELSTLAWHLATAAVKVPARRVVGFAFGPLRPVIRRATPPTLSAPSRILCADAAAAAGTAASGRQRRTTCTDDAVAALISFQVPRAPS